MSVDAAVEDELILWLASVSTDPVAFALGAFPWGVEGTSLANRSLEPWQLKLLSDVRDGLLTPAQAIQLATSSGNGVGKSAVVCILILFLHCTAEDTKGVVTANTETQLKTKTWAELGKWFNLFIAKSLFRLTATGLFSRDPERDRTWRTDMVPWSENNIAAFQGLHNEGKRLFLIFDEASGIPDVIWEAADGCMTDANTERVFAVFGNPNFPKGRFRDCFPGGKFSGSWKHRFIDSRSVSFTDKTLFDSWVKAYGEDSDFVRVRVRGAFPRVDSISFISYEIAMEAIRRPMPQPFRSHDPVVLGVDVGRRSDPTVVYPRQGRDCRTRPLEVLRDMDLMRQATRIVQLYQHYNAVAVFVDVGGVGGGLVDRLRQLGVPVWEVDFGSKPDNITRDPGTQYANKRAEIWGAVREELPNLFLQEFIPGQELTLADELAGPTYGFTGEDAVIQLERKRDMVRRGVPSPNAADALACTFAFPIIQHPLAEYGFDLPLAPTVAADYNPFDIEMMRQ